MNNLRDELPFLWRRMFRMAIGLVCRQEAHRELSYAPPLFLDGANDSGVCIHGKLESDPPSSLGSWPRVDLWAQTAKQHRTKSMFYHALFLLDLCEQERTCRSRRIRATPLFVFHAAAPRLV